MTLTKPVAVPSLAHELRTAGARLLLPFLAVGVVTVLIGLLVTRLFDGSDLSEVDVSTTRWLAENRSDTVVTLTDHGTVLGDTPVIVALTALAALVLRLACRRWREPLILVVCVTGQAVIFTATTMLIDRNRPRVVRLDDSPPTSSFPSGHTAATTAFYVGVALLVAWHTREVWARRLIVGFGLLFPLVMAFCRVYRGMHYPTDTIVSIALGLTLLALALRLMPLREGGGRVRSSRGN